MGFSINLYMNTFTQHRINPKNVYSQQSSVKFLGNRKLVCIRLQPMHIDSEISPNIPYGYDLFLGKCACPTGRNPILITRADTEGWAFKKKCCKGVKNILNILEWLSCLKIKGCFSFLIVIELMLPSVSRKVAVLGENK